MSDKKPTFFEGFKEPFEMVNKLRIVFYSLASLSVPFFTIWYLQDKNEELEGVIAPLGKVFSGIVALIAVAVAVVVYMQYQKKLKVIRKEDSLPYRLTMLLKAQSFKFIPLAVAPVVTVVLYRLTLEPLMMGVYLFSLILLAMSNPTVHTVISDLRLNKRDKEIMLQNIPFEETDMKL
ncbi:hypothetical protein [Flammeovirga aprica]|uniref:Uncharacterized protein n=1 Tax=Flammeovirga aprica JL-4 TaxID=694437 RepID=A0A7X9RRA6_9BACT|nr:hypothetical protein [Flammeovirga aprica]NME67653.1 hypothetical protein [Flammeovirga aprica JL-4]